MPFMALNSIPLSIALQGGSTLSTPTKSKVTALSELYERRPRRYNSRKYTTTPMPRDEADAVSGLLRGAGDYVSFTTHAFGDAGEWPIIGYLDGAFSLKVVNGRLTGINSARYVIDYSLIWAPGNRVKSFLRTWTVGFAWKPAGGAWTHYTVRSDGIKTQLGIAGSPATAMLTVTALGEVQIAGVVNDEVAAVFFVPYLMPVSWSLAVYNTMLAGRHLPIAPTLRMTGDVLVEQDVNEVVVVCTAQEETGVGAHFDGVWDSNARSIAFTLEEA